MVAVLAVALSLWPFPGRDGQMACAGSGRRPGRGNHPIPDARVMVYSTPDRRSPSSGCFPPTAAPKTPEHPEGLAVLPALPHCFSAASLSFASGASSDCGKWSRRYCSLACAKRGLLELGQGQRFLVESRRHLAASREVQQHPPELLNRLLQLLLRLVGLTRRRARAGEAEVGLPDRVLRAIGQRGIREATNEVSEGRNRQRVTPLAEVEIGRLVRLLSRRSSRGCPRGRWRRCLSGVRQVLGAEGGCGAEMGGVAGMSRSGRRTGPAPDPLTLTALLSTRWESSSSASREPAQLRAQGVEASGERAA